jgi:hypothetical protein
MTKWSITCTCAAHFIFGAKVPKLTRKTTDGKVMPAPHAPVEKQTIEGEKHCL